WQAGQRIVRALRLPRRLGVCLVLGNIVGRGVGGFHLAGLLILGGGVGIVGLRLLAARIVLAAFLVVVLALRLVVLARFLLVLILIFAKLVRHVERNEHVAHKARKTLLVVQPRRQGVEIGTGFLFHPVAPQRNHPLAALRH